MTFRHFLDASYALLVEGYLTVAPNRIDLLGAVEKAGGTWPKEETLSQNVPVGNDAAVEVLKGMMKNVKGGPRVGIPR